MLRRNDNISPINSTAQRVTAQAHLIQHILVAEDNHANQLIAKTILERDGYTVTIAENGQDALSAVEAQSHTNPKFDLILMDILMPIMDGMKALRRIKDLPAKIHKPPIFAITAYCSPADQHRYRMAGFDAILTKPLKHGDIEQAIEQIAYGAHNAAAIVAKTLPHDYNAIDILDAIIINQLRRAASKTVLIDIQKTFWMDIRMNSQIVRAALPESLNGTPCGLTVLRKSVHTIKGASASVGLLRAAHIARNLQNAPPSQINALLKALLETLLLSKAPLSTALLQDSVYQNPKQYKLPINQNSAAILQNGANARKG